MSKIYFYYYTGIYHYTEIFAVLNNFLNEYIYSLYVKLYENVIQLAIKATANHCPCNMRIIP